MTRNGEKTREDHRVRYTRKILKDNLISLMKERPVADIGIKEICARAEVSRSTFYVYYENVYHLLA
ncbi:MAG: TetR/AcrR family transcriptional regulator, partial [Treponema sp.]|nr:TetR/AcrR family transcriptional regulator [Treponema sp.]